MALGGSSLCGGALALGATLLVAGPQLVHASVRLLQLFDLQSPGVAVALELVPRRVQNKHILNLYISLISRNYNFSDFFLTLAKKN